MLLIIGKDITDILKIYMKRFDAKKIFVDNFTVFNLVIF